MAGFGWLADGGRPLGMVGDGVAVPPPAKRPWIVGRPGLRGQIERRGVTIGIGEPAVDD